MLRVWGTSSSYEATDDNATESNTLLERQAKEDKEDKEERWKEERREQLLAWKTARRAALEAPGSSQVSSLWRFFELSQRSDSNEFACTAFEANNPNQNNPNWPQISLQIHSQLGLFRARIVRKSKEMSASLRVNNARFFYSFSFPLRWVNAEY
jgi:hypothetical protein